MAEITETHDLIASDKVEGTPVFQPDGWRIGQIERLMLEKVSGTVAYAVLSFGGFVGIGHHHYPVPWPMLRYHQEYKGYVVSLTREQIEDAPRMHPDEHEDHPWSSEYGHDVYGFYGVPPYWMQDVGR